MYLMSINKQLTNNSIHTFLFEYDLYEYENGDGFYPCNLFLVNDDLEFQNEKTLTHGINQINISFNYKAPYLINNLYQCSGPSIDGLDGNIGTQITEALHLSNLTIYNLNGKILFPKK
jgi:hypothetical protein